MTAVRLALLVAFAAPGVLAVLRQVSRFDQPRLRTIWADAAYHRDELVGVGHRSRPAESRGFVPIRGRWVVERT